MANTMLTSFRGYVFASFLLATAVVGHAGYMKRSFYRAVVSLYNSKLAILSVGNMAFVSVLLIWRLIQAVFLGPLRFREVERLHYRARDAVIECCFAMSIFRNEFDLKFVALVMTLLLLKSLHWLAKDRIEFLEEQPLSPIRTHLRLVGLMVLLFIVDSLFIKKCAGITLFSSSATMYILFAVEFTISIIELVCDIMRYCFLVIDNSMEGHWEGKAMCSFYIELLSDLCQLTVYLFFYIYVHYHYSFPFHIVREVYVTFTRFHKRCTDFWRFRRVVATMNDLFEDATEEELAQGDRTCIICREEMETAKKLECGHLFHARCLQNWLKRQQSCPTCRAAIDITGTRDRPRSGQQPNGQANNPPQRNQQNVNGNAPEQQNIQQRANVGDAGLRLLNIANQWWNEVVIEAAAARGAGGGARDGGARAARNNAGNRGANDPGAQRTNPPGNEQQEGTRRQVPPPNNFNGGNPLLRGPNAAAHLQLRARRRVAWPYPYQPYQMQPYLQYRQQYPNMNPYQQPNFQTPIPSAPVNQSTQQPGTASNAVPTTNNAGVPEQQHGRSSGPTEGTAVAESASNELNTKTSVSAEETRQGARPAGSSTATGQSSGSPSTSTAVHSSRDRERRDPGQPAQTPRSASQSIPLDKLLSIQERIEVLRNEVMELVLLATSAPAPLESEGGGDDAGRESTALPMEAVMSPEVINGNQQSADVTQVEPRVVSSDCEAAGGEPEFADGEPSEVAGRGPPEFAGGDPAEVAGGDPAEVAGGDPSEVAGGDPSEVAGGDPAEVAGGDPAEVAGGDPAEVAGGDPAEVNGGETFQEGDSGVARGEPAEDGDLEVTGGEVGEDEDEDSETAMLRKRRNEFLDRVARSRS